MKLKLQEYEKEQEQKFELEKLNIEEKLQDYE